MRTVTHMPILLAVALIVLTGLTIKPLLAYAAHRTRRQPIPHAYDDEALVISSLIHSSDLYQDATTLAADDFADPDHQHAWAILASAAGPCPHPVDSPRTEPCGCTMTPEQAQVARDTIRADLGAAYLTALPEPVDGQAFLAAGERVLSHSSDRHLTGAATIDTSSTPPVWVTPPLGRTRLWISTGLLGLGLLAGWSLALVAYDDPVPRVLAAGAGTLLAYGVVLWSLVDHDTLYIDMLTLAIGGAVAWVFAVGAALVDGEPGRIVAGVLAGVAVAALFEGTNLLYRILRGRHGIGGGDTRLALVTIGVPTAIVGSWNFGYGALLASLMLAAGAYPLLRRIGHQGRSIPFAFGPYLAAGWIGLTLTLPVSLLLGRPW